MILYRLKILIYKQYLVRELVTRINKFFGNQSSKDIHAVKLIKKYVSKKTFIDIGCMWGINGEFCFHAEECGAKRIMGLDVYPESEEFISKKRERKSKVEFLQGDINSKETIDKIGLYDVVFCSGVLYHSPAPEYLLSRLRLICGERLILHTKIIPEMPGIRNGAVFYPFMSEQERNIWNLQIGIQRAITGPYEPESGYGNWFWGLTPSCVESLLQFAGFNVIERYIDFFDGTFVCERTDVKFQRVSGPW